jgi:tRNA U34 5-carboxymethylaminomethyl modifying enzyme MnmG/GidA
MPRPRYCPSIEDKIVRFADKESHQIFIEPEGRDIPELYIQGFSTGLPETIQLQMLRTLLVWKTASCSAQLTLLNTTTSLQLSATLP